MPSLSCPQITTTECTKMSSIENDAADHTACRCCQLKKETGSACMRESVCGGEVFFGWSNIILVVWMPYLEEQHTSQNAAMSNTHTSPHWSISHWNKMPHKHYCSLTAVSTIMIKASFKKEKCISNLFGSYGAEFVRLNQLI